MGYQVYFPSYLLNIKQSYMNEQYYQTLKSAETEDWLDFHVIRPFCFQLARLFARFNIHPNTVTIASMFIGAGSALFFAQGSFYYDGIMGLVNNLIAIFLLMWDVFSTGWLDSRGSSPSIMPWCGDSTSTTNWSSHGWVSAIHQRML